MVMAGGWREFKHYLIVACRTCGYIRNLVSVEEKGCFGVVSDSHKDMEKGAGWKASGDHWW